MSFGILEFILLLLAAAVLVVVVFRSLKLPALLGYLLLGIAIGPHAIGLVPANEDIRRLAEFGVVFLMFTIGLEFSLPKLITMRRVVFGLGAAQVLATVLVCIAAASAFGHGWRTGVVLGGILAMSSTAILAKMLAERLEINSAHGRQIIGILLFQDLAVVPFLILYPAFAQADDSVAQELLLALLRAGVLLLLILTVGQKVMRRWFTLVARQKSSELFVINVLMITLGLAWLTGIAGLSYALGAFLAGMLISETQFRYQVEEDIKPFRDVLLGLFFITVGTYLDVSVVIHDWQWVGLLLVALLAGKIALIFGLSRLFGAQASVALRAGLALAGAGEFGLVLVSEASHLELLPAGLTQVALAALVLSMLAAPFLIEHSERIVRRFSAAEWMNHAMTLHNIAIQTMAADRHVIICGFGRSGQNLARFLEQEKIEFIALDIDPQRVREAAAAGESVVFGDAARREVLIAAGLLRANALVVSYADTKSALAILAQVQELRPGMPVIVRTLDDSDIDRLKEAGAAEVVAEILEGSLMLATHALMLLGVPLNRVLRRIRETREQRYGLFKGFFRGVTDEVEDGNDRDQPRMHSLVLPPGAAAAGRTLQQLDLARLHVEVTALRRRNIRNSTPDPKTELAEGDVLVLRGKQADLADAEVFLLQG
ncbi:MAG TPA: monovalent cation:proton antiporter-2 (CPA2) family protein [Burkholderiales bacterium]|nr:monovalent cation:proton antiporter-2 (CPA2) family protein [Burkholderiales bacterium]